MRVIRGSFPILKNAPSRSFRLRRSSLVASASGNMVRNLKQMNFLPFRPARGSIEHWARRIQFDKNRNEEKQRGQSNPTTQSKSNIQASLRRQTILRRMMVVNVQQVDAANYLESDFAWL